jgi:predicted glycoside hydrolase/deacetylase ChbG (UPF0249 family)
VNRGIVESHEQGIVTSASLMVRWPAAESAANEARSHPGLSVGLHVDLGEWCCQSGEWRPVYEVVDQQDAEAVAEEISAQLTAFRRLMRRNPTHLDSHQHIHRSLPARRILREISRELKIPLRHFSQVRYCGEFYGQLTSGEPYPKGIDIENLVRILNSLSAGFTELGCHPGSDEDLNSAYRTERRMEVRALCDPAVRQAISRLGIELCSFQSVSAIA